MSPDLNAATGDAATLRSRRRDARLLIAGAGPVGPPLEARAAELGVQGIAFLGKVEPERMAELNARADVYLSSPDVDNMPLSTLEAFATGVAVVTSDADGIPYIVERERTGHLFARGDHTSVAGQALPLLSDHALARSLILNAKVEFAKYEWASVRAQRLAL